jgi:hypothetical protein
VLNKPEGKRPLGRLKSECENNFEMFFTEMMWDD